MANGVSKGYDPERAFHRIGVVQARLGLAGTLFELLVRQGRLKVTKVGKQRLVVTASVERYLREVESAPGTDLVARVVRRERGQSVAALARERLRSLGNEVHGSSLPGSVS